MYCLRWVVDVALHQFLIYLQKKQILASSIHFILKVMHRAIGGTHVRSQDSGRLKKTWSLCLLLERQLMPQNAMELSSSSWGKISNSALLRAARLWGPSALHHDIIELLAILLITLCWTPWYWETNIFFDLKAKLVLTNITGKKWICPSGFVWVSLK